MGQHDDGRFVRDIGGETMSTRCVSAAGLRVETISIACGQTTDWHFCQPGHALFWHTDGARHFRGSAGQAHIDQRLTDATNLVLIPPQVEVKACWETQAVANYVAIFFDAEALLESAALRLSEPMMFFRHRELRQAIASLCRESRANDGLFDLYAAGWLNQAVAHLVRAQRGTARGQGAGARGGLPPRRLRMLTDFLEEHLSDTISIDEMAALVGVSSRHLIRTFEQSTGETPHRYVVGRRVDRAKQLLSRSEDSITDVALSCGYGSIQHFSTAFRRETGVSPSRYRQQYQL